MLTEQQVNDVKDFSTVFSLKETIEYSSKAGIDTTIPAIKTEIESIWNSLNSTVEKPKKKSKSVKKIHDNALSLLIELVSKLKGKAEPWVSTIVEEYIEKIKEIT